MESVLIVIVLTVLGIVCGQNYAGGGIPIRPPGGIICARVQSLVSVHRDAAVLVDPCILNATEITLVPEAKNAAVPVVDADALHLCLWDNIADEVKVKLQTTVGRDADAAVLVDLCNLNATEMTLVPEIKNAAVPGVDANVQYQCLLDNIADEVEVKLQTT
ncbi:hypothetical protein MAR_032437 [Mya arenaria]|uniref:Uncharacterized protein n=1 Tax=Mya arenaria TaxID=6604 RepID=A0ABY7FAX8_MYAAR|nr:hypothetical protein MAR_032437 [Mya arenaria]